MCYPDDARPPDHGRGGEVASYQDLVLAAADGNRYAAYHTRPAAPSGAGIVVLPDVRGLHNFYRALACRFAESGVEAVAIDYFGRSAGVDVRGDDFDHKPHIEKTSFENIATDTRAAIEYLRSPDGGAVRAVFTVGFCYGGANSWRQSAEQPDLTGAIGFYGRPQRVRDVVDTMRAPLLMLVAGADFTPIEEFRALDQQLTNLGLEHKMVVFEGAPHSFFDRGHAQFQDECRRAWEEMLAFIESLAAR